jgi:serine/threonine protein kinase
LSMAGKVGTGSKSSSSTTPETSNRRVVEHASSLLAELRREGTLMAALQHPNVVAVRGVCLSPLCLVQEYMELGPLDSWLAGPGAQAPLRLRTLLANDVAAALVRLHSFDPPIVHR